MITRIPLKAQLRGSGSLEKQNRFNFYRGSSAVTESCAVVATLGNFDGLHRGHLAVLSELKKYSELKPLVISFYPHPSVTLGRIASSPRVTTIREKIAILQHNKIQALWMIHFTKKFSKLSAADFIEKYLLSFNLRHLVIGEDAKIGKDQEGDAKWISDYLNAKAIAVTVVPFIQEASNKIGSASIRKAIENGDIKGANLLLGREFSIVGHVSKGEGIGRNLGFPTANISSRAKILPKNGVYATETILKGEKFRSVTNVGVRPTFGGEKVTVETYICDYKGADFYRAICEVRFLKRLRPETKFDTKEKLIEQIKKDVYAATR